MLRGQYVGIPGLKVDIKLGGWAMGMPMLFLLHELVTKFDGLRVLEFGSGQSTKFIGEHSKSAPNVIIEHVVYEHDAKFAAKFVSDQTDIRIVQVASSWRESKYIIPDELPHGMNVIIVDGPFGSPLFSRTNILDFISRQQDLEDFVIIFDDVNRPGERITERRLMQMLRARGYNPRRKRYEGEKIVSVITPNESKFQSLLQNAWFL